MAKINIPCLVGKTNKAGITNWYWQPSATLRRAGFKPEKLGKDDITAMRRAQDLNREVDAWKLGADKKPDVKSHRHRHHRPADRTLSRRTRAGHQPRNA
jgi:hypothetical protein